MVLKPCMPEILAFQPFENDVKVDGTQTSRISKGKYYNV